MKRPVTTGALLGLVLVIGWWGVHHEARQSVARGIARFTASLPPGATFSYAGARPLLWQRGVALQGVVYHEGNISLTVQEISVSGASGYPTLGFRLHGLHARGVHYTDAQHDVLADDVVLQGLSMPPIDRAEHIVPDIAAITLQEGSLHGFSLSGPAPFSHVTIPALRVRDFATGQMTSVLFDKPVLTMRLPGDSTGRVAVLSWERLSDRGNTIVQFASAVLAGQSPQMSTVPDGVDDVVADNGDLRFGDWTGRIGQLVGHAVNDHGVDRIALNIHQLRLPRLPKGYGDRAAELAIDTTADEGQGTLSVDRMALTMPQAGSLTFSTKLDQFSRAATGAMRTGRLVSLDLTVQDAGLAGLMLQDMAKHDGVDLATERQNLLQRAQMMQIADPRLGTAYGWFADPQGRSLVIGVHPQTPIALDRANPRAGQAALLAATTVDIR